MKKLMLLGALGASLMAGLAVFASAAERGRMWITYGGPAGREHGDAAGCGNHLCGFLDDLEDDNGVPFLTGFDCEGTATWVRTAEEFPVVNFCGDCVPGDVLPDHCRVEGAIGIWDALTRNLPREFSPF